ncbi:hypothetical protein LguiA_026246 [Lonicera macranthoides]
MSPKTSRRPTSRGPINQLRQNIAQRFVVTAFGGAPDHEVAPPPLELQLITAQAPSTQHSSTTSTSTTGCSFPRNIRCKSAARSEKMKAVRAFEKKVDRRSGPTPFIYRAKKRKESGDKSHIPNTWVEVYKKNAPDAAAVMTAAVEASISSFEASNPLPPPVEGGSDSTPPAPITLPIETHIDIVQGEVGVRRGTVIRGLGIGYKRDSQSKGGVRTSNPSSEVEELRATLARMQQEREQEAEEMRRFKAEQQRIIEEQQRKMEDMEARVRLLFGWNASGGETSSRQQP